MKKRFLLPRLGQNPGRAGSREQGHCPHLGTVSVPWMGWPGGSQGGERGCRRREVPQKWGQEGKEGDYRLVIRKQGIPTASNAILNLCFTEVN